MLERGGVVHYSDVIFFLNKTKGKQELANLLGSVMC